MEQDNRHEPVDKKDREEEIKKLLSIALTPEAYTRLMNVKIANPEFYQKAAALVLQVFSRYGRKIDEATLIDLLKKLKDRTDRGKDGSITIMRK